ncbi:MAG TPA: hypothetical protein VN788_11880, partial [Verrucomicrobiae bacterium]|nr:hypothetical protein [Verrucomicrobiae bacterium]
MNRPGSLRTAVFVLLILFAVCGICARAQEAPSKPVAPATSAPQQAPATPNPQAAAPPQQPPIVSTTGLVHLVVTVVDRHHDFITDLDKTDFKVLDNGSPQ